MAFPATTLPVRVYLAPTSVATVLPTVTEVGTTAYASANTATITTASFTPANNVLLVALCSMGNGTGTASSLGAVTDSLGGVWTRLVGNASTGGGVAEVWCRDVATGAAMTVTYDPGGTGASGLDIIVKQYSNAQVTAAQRGATAAPAGGGSYSATITTTVAGSLVVGAYGRGTDAQTVTANALTTKLGQVNGSAGDTAALFTAASTTVTPGAVTLGFSNASGGTNWLALAEILPVTAASSVAWTEITSDVRVADGITITAGAQDEGSTVDPGSCTLTLNNRNGTYSPRNANGPYYGSLSRNVPLQVRLDAVTDSFTRVVGAGGWGTTDSGYAWNAPVGTGTWSVSGSAGQVAIAAANSSSYSTLAGVGARDLDMVFSSAVSAVTTGAPWISAAYVRFVDANNCYRINTEFKPANIITCKITRILNGVATDLSENLSTGVTYAANGKVYTRIQADGPTIRVKVWTGSLGAEPATWSLSTTDTVMIPGTAIGSLQWRFTGNTNVGTLTSSIDDLAIQSILFTGVTTELPVRWNVTGADSWVPVKAAGPLRQLGQRTTALRSPLYRQLIKQSPTGYWPLEDDSTATAGASAVSGGYAATVSDVTFANETTLKGAAQALTLNSAESWVNGRTSGRLSSGSTGFAFMWMQKLASLPGSKQNFMEFWSTGTVTHWVIQGDGIAFYVLGYNTAGDLVVNSSALYTVDPTKWTACQLETQISGGTVTWTFIWTNADVNAFYFQSGTYAGSTGGAVTQFRCKGTASLSLCHAWAGDQTLPFVAASFFNAASGYNGEDANTRVARLGTEEGIPVAAEPGTAVTATPALLGPQSVQSFLELLREAETSDQGILMEAGTGLVYRPLAGRYNRPVALAMDINSGHVAGAPEPTDDDQKLRNDWTVSRRNGGSARAVNDADAALHGTYDSGVTVNLSTDAVLADHAAWRVHLGTVDAPRWPRVNFSLARNTSLIGSWLACVVGARVTVAHPPSAMNAIDIDLIMEGYTQRLGPFSWDVELNCSPAQPHNVAVYDAAASRYDTAGSSLASSCTSGATSLSVAVTNPADLWTTSGGSFPFDINVDGERCTVTAISGASSPQTFTVTRAVNGVVKAHASGTSVKLWAPVYYAV
jgi:hypothetical protein